MKRDPEKARAWQERSRKKAAENARKKKRKPLKQTAPKGRGRNWNGQAHDIISQAKIDQHRRFQLAAQAQRVCQRCGKKGPWHPHHVVYKQWLETNHHPPDDEDNALRLCPDCHHGHHYGTKRQTVALRQLKSCNLDYAFRIMGAAAGSYLRRRYRGDDPRLDAREESYEH